MNNKTDYWNNPNCSRAINRNRISAQILEPLDKFAEKNITKKCSSYSIEKLYELITDPVTQDNEVWINRLLHNSLQEHKSNGYKVKNLAFIMRILEFLASKVSVVPAYEEHLNKLLDICAHPPLLEKSSDILSCTNILSQYFTVLGELIIQLLGREEASKVLDTIHQLLTRPKPVEIGSVKLEYCVKAVEKSRLPVILAELLTMCPSGIYKKVLTVTAAVVARSKISCHAMLEAGVINHLLLKLNDFSNQSDDVSSMKFINNNQIVIINILWSLMQSILPTTKLGHSSNSIPTPSLEAMRSLRNIFYRITYDKQCNKCSLIRNDLATIILAGLVALPSSWNLLHCGLTHDIIDMIDLTESLTSTNEDFFFIKTLLAILCHFSTVDCLIFIMKESHVMKNILQLLDHKGNHLSPYALRTLSCLVPKIPDEFVSHKGPAKLLNIIDDNCMTVEANNRVSLEAMRTIFTLVNTKSPILMEAFRTIAINLILKFIDRTLAHDQLTLQRQRLLTLYIMTIEILMASELNLVEVHADCTINLVMKLLERCRRQHQPNDFPKDERLLIAVGSFIWKCIITVDGIVDKFVTIGGTYLMLDVLEHESLYVQNVYLGALTDLCTCTVSCIPHICTWRGTDKTKGFMSLLANSWRREEIQLGVKRTREGCVEDVELPLMGTAQWQESLNSRNNPDDYSLTLASMLGSVRPRIYSLRKLLLTNSELCEKSKEHYKILLHEQPIEDTITFCIIDQFFRFTQGQVWSEVLTFLRKIGINPLGIDGEMLLLMRQRNRGCALYVKERQEKILRDARKKEVLRELEELIKIRDKSRDLTLSREREIDYIRRTTDQQYRLQKKSEQTQQINQSLCFPIDADNCQRTYNEAWNVTTILNQNCILKIKNKNSEDERNEQLPLISPLTSEENLKLNYKDDQC